MAGNIRIGSGVETPAQSRTSVSGEFRLPARPAPAPQAPAGYGLAYQMGGPSYMYGVTPRFGAYYRDGGTPPGQIHGNFPGAREGADMFGFWPTMFQTSPYATASQMYTPGLGVMPLVGYPSRYPHVVMGGYSDWGGGVANQAISMMLPLVMMGLYRQMFPMPGAAPAQAAASGGGGKKGSGGGSGEASPSAGPVKSSGVPDGTPAVEYSAVDGMPIRPSQDSTYRVRDTDWKPGAAPTGDSWVDRAIGYGKRFPPTMPLAFGLDYARRHPDARRAVEGAVPVFGPIIRGADEYLSR